MDPIPSERMSNFADRQNSFNDNEPPSPIDPSEVTSWGTEPVPFGDYTVEVEIESEAEASCDNENLDFSPPPLKAMTYYVHKVYMGTVPARVPTSSVCSWANSRNPDSSDAAFNFTIWQPRQIQSCWTTCTSKTNASRSLVTM